MKIHVVKLDQMVYSGDWHDAPLKWGVYGPGDEVQLFRTKNHAVKYKSIRKCANSFKEAVEVFVKASIR